MTRHPRLPRTGCSTSQETPRLGQTQTGVACVAFPSLSRPQGQGVLHWGQEGRMTCAPHSSRVFFLPWQPSLGTGASQGMHVSVGTVRCAHRSAFERPSP